MEAKEREWSEDVVCKVGKWSAFVNKAVTVPVRLYVSLEDCSRRSNLFCTERQAELINCQTCSQTASLCQQQPVIGLCVVWLGVEWEQLQATVPINSST